jgi:hypothetical protein
MNLLNDREGLAKTLDILKAARLRAETMPKVHYCFCGKKPMKPEWLKQLTHLKGYILDDTRCSDCRTMTSGMVQIFCVGCQDLLTCVEPYVTKSGFKLKGGHIYHARNCPKCNKELAEKIKNFQTLVRENPAQELQLQEDVRIKTIEEEIYVRNYKK